jgi:PAT family beta-lactamase induction signal transducer AmpG
LLTGTSAGALIDAWGYVDFYLLTTVLALPGIVIFWVMMRTDMVDEAIGSAGRVESAVGAEEAGGDVHPGARQGVTAV